MCYRILTRLLPGDSQAWPIHQLTRRVGTDDSMPSLRLTKCAALLVGLGVALAVAEKVSGKGSVAALSLEDVEEKLQVCLGQSLTCYIPR